MPETIPEIRPSFNRSLRLDTRSEWLSADTGALVQREMMDRSGLIDWLTERLHDPRHPGSIRYPLSDLLRTRLLLLGQGWRDQSDADRLRQDPSLRVASRTRRGTAALEEGLGLASQPTLSRLLDTLSREENLPVLHLGRVLMEQTTRRGWSLRRFRERLLRVASRALRQGRRLIFVIGQGATDWKRLWKRLARVSWAPG